MHPCPVPETEETAAATCFRIVETRTPAPEPKRLLLVDDDRSIREMVKRMLVRQGHACTEVGSGAEALELLRYSTFDAAIIDLRMPGMDGLELLAAIRDHYEDLPILVATGSHESRDAVQTLKLGADEYVNKPFEAAELSRALSSAVEKRAHRRRTRDHQLQLEALVSRRTQQLQDMFVDSIRSLIQTLEAKDPYTHGHSRRVSWIAGWLADAAGLPPAEVGRVRLAGMLHDLGKIGVPEAALNKEGALSPAEQQQIRLHPEIGVRILEPLRQFRDALPMILHHHERWDGRGYPAGLAGPLIPMGARIIAVADAFDAMTSRRSYRRALAREKVVAELETAAGKQLDPVLVSIFLPVARSGWIEEVLGKRPRSHGEADPSLRHEHDRLATPLLRRRRPWKTIVPARTRPQSHGPGRAGASWSSTTTWTSGTSCAAS